MNDERIQQQFKMAVKYKEAGFVILMSAIVPILILKGIERYAVAAMFIAIGVFLEKQYKCPACKHVFDSRIEPKKLTRCPECKKKLQ